MATEKRPASFASELLQQFLTEQPPFQTELVLKDFILALKKDNCSSVTIRNYRSDINQFIRFCGVTTFKELLTKNQILAFVQAQHEKGLKPSSITRKLASIARVGLWVKEQGVFLEDDLAWITNLNVEKLLSGEEPQAAVFVTPIFSTGAASVSAAALPQAEPENLAYLHSRPVTSQPDDLLPTVSPETPITPAAPQEVPQVAPQVSNFATELQHSHSVLDTLFADRRHSATASEVSSRTVQPYAWRKTKRQRPTLPKVTRKSVAALGLAAMMWFNRGSLYDLASFIPGFTGVANSVAQPLTVAWNNRPAFLGKSSSATETPETTRLAQANTDSRILGIADDLRQSRLVFNIVTFFTEAVTLENSLSVAGDTTLDGPVALNADLTGAPAGVTIDLGAGEVFASNLIYSITAGDGIAITGDQELTLAADVDTFSSIVVGSSTIEADGVDDELTLVAGSNVSLGVSGSEITISSTDTSGWLDNGSSVSLVAAGDLVGIGTASPTAKVEIVGTGEQMRLAYDASNYAWFQVASDGSLELAATGEISFDDSNLTDTVKLSESDTGLVGGRTGLVDAINDALDAVGGVGGGIWTRDALTGILSPTTITDDLAIGGTTSAAPFYVTDAGTITFATDTNLYRRTTNVLKTDDAFEVGSNFAVQSTGQITAATNETINGIDIVAGAVSDVTTLVVNDSISTMDLTASGTVTIGDINLTGTLFQSAGNLSISPSGTLTLGTETYDTYVNGDVITFNDSNQTTAIPLSVADDGINANLGQGIIDALNDLYDLSGGGGGGGEWTVALGVLYPSTITNDLAVGGTTSAAPFYVTDAGVVSFATDTNLYRGGVNLLQTDDGFQAASLTDGTVSIATGIIDLGTNTITDADFSGNWDWSAGNLSNVGTLTAATLTDGTASLTSGGLSGLTSVAVDNLTLNGSTISSSGSLSFDDINLLGAVPLTLADTALDANLTQGIIDAINDLYTLGTGGGGGAWTIASGVIYPTDTTNDLAIGGTGSGAPLFFDESAELLTLTNTTGGNSFVVNDVAGDTSPFVIDEAGYVGIGTTDPLAPINLISPSSFDQAVIQQWGYTNATNATGYNLKLKQVVTSGVVRWTFDQTNNSTSYPNVLTIDRGKVGIGTTDPQNNLVVFQSSTSTAGLRIFTTTTPATETNVLTLDVAGNLGSYRGPAIQFKAPNNSGTSREVAQIIGSTGASNLGGALNLKTTDASNVLQSRLFIENSGYLGIGDTSPAALFTVGSGDLFQVNSSGNIASLGGVAHSIANSAGALAITSNGALNFDDSNLSAAVPVSAGATAIDANLTQGIVDAINDLYSMGTGGGGVAGFFTRSSGLIYPTTTTDNLSLGTSSNLGKLAIAGDTDEVQLLVRGNGTQTNDIFQIQTSTPTTLLSIANSGNISFQPTAFGSAITLYDTDTSFDSSDTGIVDAINTAYNAATGGGSGLWSVGSGIIYPTTTTQDLAIGGSTSSSPFFFDTSAELLTLTNTTAGNSLVVNDVAGDTTPFVIDETGNVGIGTTDPSAKLDVQGNSYLNGIVSVGNTPSAWSALYGVVQVENAALWSQDGAIDTMLTSNSYFNGTNYVSQVTGAATRVRLTSIGGLTIATAPSVTAGNNQTFTDQLTLLNSGNFGIGDGTPAALFTVGASDAFQINSSGNIDQIGDAAHTISNSSGTLNITSVGSFTFDDSNLTAALPLTLADIAINANLAQGLVDAINDLYDLGTSGGGSSIWSLTSNVAHLTDATDDLAIGGSTSAAPLFFDESAELLTLTNTTGGNSFVVNDVASDTTPFVIDEAGNVGIGASDPAQLLHLTSATDVKTRYQLTGTGASTWDVGLDNDVGTFNIINGANYRLNINGSGFVGIGTTNQYSKLHVDISDSTAAPTGTSSMSAVDAGVGLTISNSNVSANYTALDLMTRTSGSSLWRIINEYKSASNGDLAFRSNNGPNSREVLRLMSTGYVGIGSTAPASRLDIVSSALNSDVQRWMASDGSRLGRFTETSGGHGWFEVDDSAGTALALFRADGGDSYVNGDFGVGNTAPAALFAVGATSEFQVNSTGQITAATDETINGVDINAGAISDVTSITASGTVTGNILTANTSVDVGLLTLSSSTLTSSGDLNLTATTSILFDDANLTAALPLTLADTAIDANLDQGIVDAINDLYALTTGGGTGSIWSRDSGNGYTYLTDLTDSLGVGTTAPTSKLNVTDTATSLPTNGLGYINWQPGSTATFTGDLVAINVGANATVDGNLFNVLNNGSSLFSVSQTQVISNVPVQFNSPGNLGVAYDIVLTNQTASAVRSYGPFTLEAGESFESNDLTLKTYNAGDIVADMGGNLVLASADPAIVFDTTTATDTDFWMGVTEDAGSDDDDLFQIGDGNVIGTNPFLTINTSGNVGVGTTNPTSAFQVYSLGINSSSQIVPGAAAGQSDVSTGVWRVNSLSTGNHNLTLTLQNVQQGPTSGTRDSLTTTPSFNPTSGTGVINTFTLATTVNQTGGANGITRGLYVNPTLTAAADWRSIELSNNSGFGIYQSGASALNYFAGNVGIGTTAPASRLDLGTDVGSIAHIGGMRIFQSGGISYLQSGATRTGGSWAPLYFGSYSSGTDIKMAIDLSGNVGIGTTAPSGKMHVSNGVSGVASYNADYNEIIAESNGHTGLAIYSPDASLSRVIFGNPTDNYAANFTWDYTNNLMAFATARAGADITFRAGDEVDAMRILDSGYVGIGTTAPATKLNVSGGATFTLAAAGLTFGDGDTGFYESADDTLRLTVASTDVAAINATNLTSLTTNGASILWGAGSATTPSFTFDSDANTGMFRAAADTLAFATAGTEQLRISSDGYVGIGTTAPTANLNVYSVATSLSTNGMGYFNWQPGSAASFTGDLVAINAGSNATINGNLFNVLNNSSSLFSVSQSKITANLPTEFTAAGDVSIAYDLQFTNQTSSSITSKAPLYLVAGESFESNDLTLRTYNAGDIVADMGGNLVLASADPALVFDTTTPTDTDFWMGVTEDAGSDDDDLFQIGDGTTIGTNPFVTINTSGNVGIGTTNPTTKLYVKSSGTNDVATFESDNSTSCTLSAGGVISCTSDQNLKKNITNLDTSIDIVRQLRAVTFNWNSQLDSDTKVTGFIAQEVESILPELVSTSANGYKSLSQVGMIPFLVQAIQEQQDQLDSLQLATTVQTLQVNNTTGGNLLDLKSDDITQFAVTQDGQVGIGLDGDTPAFKLQVRDTQTASAAAQIFNASTDSEADGLEIKLAGSSLGTGNSFVSFRNGNGELVGAITGNASGDGVTYATEGQDFAEYFRKADLAEQLPAGTIVCMSENGVTTCSDQNQQILGVVSDRPGFVGGISKAGDPNYVLVGLLGQLPVKVDQLSAAIQSGDAITISNSGLASRTTTSGYIVGKAATAWTPGQAELMLIIRPGFYMGDLSATGTIASLPSFDESPTPDGATDSETTSPAAVLADIELLKAEIASMSAQIAELENSELALRSDLMAGVFSPTATESAGIVYSNGEQPQVSAQLAEFGFTNLDASVFLNKPFQVGILTFDNLTASIDSPKTLQLQSNGTAGIALVGGKVQIAKDGSMTVAGELTAQKLTIAEPVLAAVIPTEPVLTTTSSAVLGTSTPEATTSGAVAENTQAEGAQVATNQASIGQAILKAGTTQVTVKTTAITAQSKLFTSPRTKTGGQALIVESINPLTQTAIISIETAITSDITFDWWIVDFAQQ